MNWEILSIFFVIIGTYGSTQGTGPSNPECTDLDKLQRHAARLMRSAGGSLNCKPNANCTGLACSGSLRNRPFKGEMILEGCQDPVKMVIKMNKKHFVVADGYMAEIIPSVHFYVFVALKKIQNIVYVSATLKMCPMSSKICVTSFPIVKNQPIRVSCSKTGSAVPTLPWTGPRDKISTPTVRIIGDYGTQGTATSNRECTDLENLQSSAASVMRFVEGSLKCKPNNNCTGMACSGTLYNKPFEGEVVLEGCHDPVRMVIRMQKRRLVVKDGYHALVNRDYRVYVFVALEKKANVVYVTVTLKSCLSGNLKNCISLFKLLDNKPVHVNCNEDTPTALLPTSPVCSEMSKMAYMVEQRLVENKASRSGFRAVRCRVEGDCSVLHCWGKKGKGTFDFNVTVDCCQSPPVFHLRIKDDGKTVHVLALKDGNKVKKPLPIGVQLKETKKFVLMNVTIQHQLVIENGRIEIDSGRCAKSGKSMSVGEIVGIAIAVVVIFALLVVVIVWVVRGKRARAARRYFAMNDDTDPLVFDSGPVVT